jgi:hypothetical protein
MPIKPIARRLGVGRYTVRRALAAESAAEVSAPGEGLGRRRRGAADPELLEAWPSMPATVIAERIGWTRSLRVLKDRVRELRPLFLASDPASRTENRPGELAQCDLWFPLASVPLGAGQTGSPPVLVTVSGYT